MQHTEEGDFCIYKAVYIGLQTKSRGVMPPSQNVGGGATALPAPPFPTPLMYTQYLCLSAQPKF